MCQRILSEELNKRRIAAKYVPRLMGNNQKELCIAVCTERKTAQTLFPTSSLVMNLNLNTVMEISLLEKCTMWCAISTNGLTEVIYVKDIIKRQE